MGTLFGAFMRRFWGSWRRQQDERLLLTTFWPQDYWQGTICQSGEQDYQITRHVRAADPRFFEIWGRVVSQGATRPDMQVGPMPRISEQRAA